MLHLLFICGGEKNKRMRGQKTRSETLKRWGKVLTCEQLKPRRAAIWIQTGGRETLYSTVCRSAVSTERAELWFCLISWRAEQVAQIRKRLLQNNNQKIGKSEWSEWWMNGGSDYAPHSQSFRQNDSVEKSLLHQNPDWTSGTSPIRILNLIGLFLPEPNRYYHSEKAQLAPFFWFPEHLWICRAEWSALPLGENDSHPGLISFWSQRNQFGSPLISDSTISFPHLCLNVSGGLIVGRDWHLTDVFLNAWCIFVPQN